MTEVTATRAVQVLARLREQYGVSEFDPECDFTTEQAGAAMNMTPNQARLYLAREVQDGRLTERPVVLNGRRRKVYRAVA